MRKERAYPFERSRRLVAMIRMGLAMDRSLDLKCLFCEKVVRLMLNVICKEISCIYLAWR